MPKPASQQFLSTLGRTIEEGVLLQRQGRLAEAEKIYTRVLKILPDQFETLQLLERFERSAFADGFLENVISWKRDELTTRQGEILLALRDEAEIHYKFKGLSIPILIDKCFANRFDLDDGDRQRIQRLRESGKRYVTGGQMGWFKRICKQLNEMERYM